MSDVAFVYPPVPGRLTDLAHVLRTELERQGMATSEHVRFPEPDPARLYVLVDPGRYIETAGFDVLPARRLLRRTLALTAQDTIGGPDAPSALLEIVGRVFDISQASVTAMHAGGIHGRLLRPGYCREWDGFDPDARREIDIAFYGGYTPRAERALSDIADVLARHRAAIHVVEAGAVDPEQRRALFRRAKIALQLHPGADPRLDWLQAMDAMHNGAVLVAEHSTDLGPFEPGRQLFLGSAPSVAWIAQRLLNDEQSLASARRAAYERLRDWLPFSLSVGVLRAALIELLGRPLDGADPESGESADLRADAEPDADATVLAQLQRTHEDLLDVRRQLDHLQASVAIGPAAREETTILRGSAWETGVESSLSALLTVGGDPAATLRTLESLITPLPAGMELVIVGSGEPQSEVTAWCDAHPEIPVAQVTGAPGLAAARNTGLAVVRAPACLLVDAGVSLYPRCVAVLTDVLRESADCGFAHPLLALRDPDGEGVGLLGVSSGSRAAPVIARAELLREAGGFVGQSPRDGVESDGLWARLSMPGRRIDEILSHRTVTGNAAELSAASV